MTYSAEEGAKLSTVKDDSSGFYIPAGYADVVPALREAGVELKLNVFMANAPLRTMLADESSRAAAVTEIVAELGRVYPDLGYNPYSGVTIDFEGLRAADKESFNAFMMELSAALHAEGKTLYAAVMPAVYGDAYFDGYDFKTLGTLCDRVILMAHDYAASGQHIFLWYEDARSIAEKLSCAKLVGVTSVSVWRLGLIPDYADEGLHYDVMSVL